MNTTKTIPLTLIALFAFAANSVFCRLALNSEQVPPLDFTVIRLISASLVLAVIILLQNKIKLTQMTNYGSYAGALYLFIYAAGFSYAYVSLGTATGALILFACVQFTMLFKAWLNGSRMGLQEHIGVLLSVAGFVYFVLPELEKPSLVGCILMAIAGVAWGFYSIVGSKSKQPLYDTASNFLRLMPISLLGLAFILVNSGLSITPMGWVYTIASGALASGVGYAIWYLVLPNLAPSIAAVCQLSVPIWAAAGGILLVNEPIDMHLAISTTVILGGILLVILAKAKR
ncbi:DMT family transporter [Paraglaciecola marina]|uniref:DMT family transporter n=1 Tax=Paraglaciecola marina TaxID=2500157 RepID=UPI0010609DD3|nr:DMT family transporter [Paraglaciecola marina]